MKRYRDAREDIKKQLHTHLKGLAQQAGNGGDPGSANDKLLDKDVDDSVNRILDEFEYLVNARGYHSFGRGVWQGFWGSVLFVFILALLGVASAILHYGNAQDPIKLLKSFFGKS